MAAKGTKTEVGTEKPTTRRAPSKKAAEQGDKPARTEMPVTGKAAKSARVPMLSQEMIAERAYHISHSGEGGTDEENWHRAEAELRHGV
jgi:hypothetical protein